MNIEGYDISKVSEENTGGVFLLADNSRSVINCPCTTLRDKVVPNDIYLCASTACRHDATVIILHEILSVNER